MPKIPGVTSEILKKKVLEALEGIGITASDIMGKGTNVRRLTKGPDINPFKPNMLEAMRMEKLTMNDALDAFANEAKYIMNANDSETLNFLNNLNTYKSIGGESVDPQGVGSMFKAMSELENAAKELKKGTEDMSAHSKKMWDDMILTAQHEGDPFKVPDNKALGGSRYNEGNIRTALRQFLQSEFKNGRLNLNEKDQFRIMKYSPMSEDDPILVFKRIYGNDATNKVGEISDVFRKGESFSHYEELLRNSVDEKYFKPLNQADVGDGKLVLTEAEEIKPKLPDDEVPFNQGGRVGMWKGSGKKLFNFTKEQLLDAANNIFPTGDRKYDAEMVAESLIENNPKMFKNRLRDDLLDSEYTEVYGEALDALSLFNMEAGELIKRQRNIANRLGLNLNQATDQQKLIIDKYGDQIDDTLLDYMVYDPDPQRQAEIMASIDEAKIMIDKGMGADEVITAQQKASRTKNATGGGVGSMFRGV